MGLKPRFRWFSHWQPEERVETIRKQQEANKQQWSTSRQCFKCLELKTCRDDHGS